MTALGSIPANADVQETNAVLPAGVLMPFAGAAAPTGWLICDGAAVSRTTYAALYTAIGTTYGVGDGSTTFNLPDTRDRVPVGISATITRGSTGGVKTHTLTAAESGLPAHAHTATSGTTGNHAHSRSIAQQQTSLVFAAGGDYSMLVNPDTLTTSTNGDHAHSVTVNNSSAVGASAAHQNMQPYIGLYYIIKY